jgi:hypothetical protein
MGISPPKTRHQRVTNATPNSGSCVADLSDYERGTNLSPCHTERETGVEMIESLLTQKQIDPEGVDLREEADQVLQGTAQ